MKQCYFNKIIIIQSLSETELQTGNKILEDIELYNVIHERELKIDLVNVKCKDDLISVFIRLTEEAKTKKIIPIVHFELHGSSETDGLILSTHEFISWEELKQLFIELNIATQLNLLLVFAACYGAYFTKNIVPTDRSPCWGLVGPIKTVTSGNLIKSFSSFYKETLESGNGDEAVKKLNQNSKEDEEGDYFSTTAEMFFIQAYKQYIVEFCNDDKYGESAKKIRKKLVLQKKEPLPSVADIQLFFEQNQENLFEKHRSHFFMYDFYPDNKARFTVKYEEVIIT